MRMIVNDRAFEDARVGMTYLARIDEVEFAEVYIDGLCFEGDSIGVMDDLISHFGFDFFF